MRTKWNGRGRSVSLARAPAPARAIGRRKLWQCKSHPRADPRPRRHAQHPAQEQPALETLLQQAPLPRAQPDRALLLEAEALPPRRYPLRQARRQLPRHDPTRVVSSGRGRYRRRGDRVAPLMSASGTKRTYRITIAFTVWTFTRRGASIWAAISS